MEIFRYNRLNQYLLKMFGTRVLKICVDGGFTCPNRDGTAGTGGCDFCSSSGSGELINKGRNVCGCENYLDYISAQINAHLNSYRGKRASKFIVYFQNYTNTYDTLENLKARYDKALCESKKIVGLQVATRPDCINKDIAKLLASYKENYYVCVELGFQTESDLIKKDLNINYTTADFINAVKILHEFQIPVVAHIMLGLPNDNDENVAKTIQIVNDLHCEGIKIHSTYVLKNTKLESRLNSEEYQPLDLEQYVEKVVKIISNLDKNIVIHRLTADPPKELLVAPNFTAHKKIVLNSIEKMLKEKDIFQGDKKLEI